MRRRPAVAGLVLTSAIASAALVRAGQQGVGQSPSQFPLSNAIRERGSSVTGAFEGWYRNRDGRINLLVGYFNRNTKQDLDIPVGPQNQIEPGGPDQVVPVRLSPEMTVRLDREAEAAGFTRSDAIREACGQWLKRQARKKTV